MSKRVNLTLDDPVLDRLEELRLSHKLGPSLVIEAFLMQTTPAERDQIIKRLVLARAVEKERAQQLKKKVLKLAPEHLEWLAREAEKRTGKGK